MRERLVQMLRQSRGTYEKALSPRWQGVEQRVAKLHEGLPLWVLASVVALLLGAVFAGLRFKLGGDANAPFSVLAGLDAVTVEDVARLAKELGGELRG